LKIDNGTSGFLAALLVDKERGQQRAGADQLSDRASRPPALIRRFHQREDEQQHPAGDQCAAEEVEVGQRRTTTFAGDQQEDRPEQHRRDRRVHEQHPAPPRPFGEHAAQEDAGG
jgi:hypothetical protein